MNDTSPTTTSLTGSRKSYGGRTILVVYGGPGEHHELAVSNGGKAKVVEGNGIKMGRKSGATVLNWQTSSSRRIINLACGLSIYIVGMFPEMLK